MRDEVTRLRALCGEMWDAERIRTVKAALPGLLDRVERAEERVAELEKDIDRLRWGIVANAGRASVGRRERWAFVRDAIGCGGTLATKMCVAAGFDPGDVCGIEPNDDASLNEME